MLCFTSKLGIIMYVTFWKMVSDFVVLCANVPDVCSIESVSLISVVPDFSVGALVYFDNRLSILLTSVSCDMFPAWMCDSLRLFL